MKKIIVLFLSVSLIVGGLSACGKPSNTIQSPKVTITATNTPKITPTPQATEKPTPDYARDRIVVYSLTEEIKTILEKYKELHPEFPYQFNFKIYATVEIGIEGGVITPIDEEAVDAPDLFVVNEAELLRFTKGDWSQYISSYEDLGLNVDDLVKNAGIDRFNIETGTGQDGKLKGLSYSSSQGTFIYRRSIAREVWGTDDPTVIGEKLGDSWEDFLKAAEELKKKGYAIVPGYDELWKVVEDSADKPWVMDGKLYIDPKREVYLDLAKTMKEHDLDNGWTQWQEEWYESMSGEGKGSAFGYFSAWWFPPYVAIHNSGGKKPGDGTYGDWAVCKPPLNFNMGDSRVLVNANTVKKEELGQIIDWMFFDTSEKGLQSLLANGTFNSKDNTKVAAASSKVLKQVDATSDFLGGQNPFTVYADLEDKGSGRSVSAYDDNIASYWLEQVRLYADGKISRKQAIEDFKKSIKENFKDKIIVE